MIIAFFYFFTALLVYTYLGYPILLGLFARCFRKPHATDDEAESSVTLIISARNEEQVIFRKIENALALDYPRDRLSIIVVSDKSTDGTEAIVEGFQDRGVRLLRTQERQGKTSGLNMAVALVESDIVVFSDANAMYHPSALRKLVRHFADPHVGYVVGLAKYENAAGSAAGHSEETYWDLETQIKHWESSLSSVVGADGAIYAIRRELYEPLEESDINDFVNPLQIVAKGYRGVYDAEAVCFESVAGEFGREYDRKVRIVNRAFNGFLRVPAASNPFKVGWFAWQLISHKLLRWFSPYLLGIHFLLCMAVGREGFAGTVSYLFVWLYAVAAVLGFLGWVQDRRARPCSRVLYLPYYFWLMNMAAAVGVWLRIRGITITTWETVRQSALFRNESAGLLPLILLVVFGMAMAKIFWWHGYGRTMAVAVAYAAGLAIVYAFAGIPARTDAAEPDFQGGHRSG